MAGAVLQQWSEAYQEVEAGLQQFQEKMEDYQSAFTALRDGIAARRDHWEDANLQPLLDRTAKAVRSLEQLQQVELYSRNSKDAGYAGGRTVGEKN